MSIRASTTFSSFPLNSLFKSEMRSCRRQEAEGRSNYVNVCMCVFFTVNTHSFNLSTPQKHFHLLEALPPLRSTSTSYKHFHLSEALPPLRNTSNYQNHFHPSEALPPSLAHCTPHAQSSYPLPRTFPYMDLNLIFISCRCSALQEVRVSIILASSVPRPFMAFLKASHAFSALKFGSRTIEPCPT